jgi:hypothetical protein
MAVPMFASPGSLPRHGRHFTPPSWRATEPAISVSTNCEFINAGTAVTKSGVASEVT